MADHVHRVTVRIKNNNHVLFSGSYMDDVQKNLSPGLVGFRSQVNNLVLDHNWTWGQVAGTERRELLDHPLGQGKGPSDKQLKGKYECNTKRRLQAAASRSV